MRVGKMKILYPSKMTCKKIKNFIEQYYDNNDEKKLIGLYKAIKTFCEFYELPLPKLKMRRTFKDTQCLGQCSDDGLLEFIYPSCYHPLGGNKKNRWTRMVFHELGHYYLWSNAEKKANEFEREMMRRCK